MTWWLWTLIGVGILLLIPVALTVAMMVSPQLFTLWNVLAWSRWHKRMKNDARYVEVNDAEGNHLGFELRADDTTKNATDRGAKDA